jgi:hypothetical protein
MAFVFIPGLCVASSLHSSVPIFLSPLLAGLEHAARTSQSAPSLSCNNSIVAFEVKTSSVTHELTSCSHSQRSRQARTSPDQELLIFSSPRSFIPQAHIPNFRHIDTSSTSRPARHRPRILYKNTSLITDNPHSCRPRPRPYPTTSRFERTYQPECLA